MIGSRSAPPACRSRSTKFPIQSPGNDSSRPAEPEHVILAFVTYCIGAAVLGVAPVITILVAMTVESMVGVTGFEPATPTSRTWVLRVQV